ncbi:MAG: TRAP transporter substrate-binding protein DctP [Dehalococcoidia bacterium]|nr:TRAP transporter substrate-binding protein DctP [Dehalococcoidia bacterium]
MKHKFIMSVLAVAVIASVLAAGCAPEAAPSTPTPEEGEAVTPSPAAPEGEVIEWLGQHHDAAGGSKNKRFQEFCDRVNLASNGRMKLTLQAGGGIVPATEEFDATHKGLIDFCEAYSPYVLDVFPNAGLFAYTVGGLSALEYVYWMRNGGGAALYDEMLDGYGVTLIHGKLFPPETFIWTTKPLETVADMKGLKFRTAGDDGEMFKEMGVSVVFMAGGEVYEATQRGVIDAFQLADPAIDIELAAHEVADYCYLSPVRQPTDYSCLGINTESWEALPADLKQVVDDAYLANSLAVYGELMASNIEALKFLKDYGTTVGPIPKEIEDELIRQANLFYDKKAAEDPFYEEILTSMREFKAAYGEAYARY